MPRKLIIIVASIIGLLILYNLGKQINDSLQAEKRLGDEVNKLTQLQSRNQQLKDQLSQITTPGFIETQARNKLNLARPGETVVIIPPAELDKVLNAKKTDNQPKLPNWQGWLRLFAR